MNAVQAHAHSIQSFLSLRACRILDGLKGVLMRIRLSVFFLLVVSLMLLLATGCSRDTTPPADTSVETARGDIVAFVNDAPVSRDDFERGKQQLLSRYQQIYSPLGLDVRTQLEGAQGRLFELRIEDEALEMAIARALIVGELTRRDAPVSDANVDAEFQRQYSEFLAVLGMSEQELVEAFDTGDLAGFQTGGLTFDQFIASTKQTVREEFELQAVQRLIAGTIEHTEATLIAFFEERRTEYDIAEQVRASHILVATEELAQQALAVLASGGNFAALAREISADTGTKEQGGDLGWFGRGRMVPPFEEAAFNTPVGELSGIVRTEYGYHIISVTDYRREQKPAYEDVADLVARDFDADVRAQQFDQWYTVARSTASISIEDLMLDAFRKHQEDVDQGLQAYLRLQDESLVDDPYLDYIIGTIYETKMDEAQSEKLGIEGNETIAPSQQERIDALEVEIETNRAQALTSYRAALTQLGEDAEIEARIQALELGL